MKDFKQAKHRSSCPFVFSPDGSVVLHLSPLTSFLSFLSLSLFIQIETQERLSPQRDYVTKWKAYFREEGHTFPP